ncbi:MAG TPA: hypothetical protein VI457_02425 [Methylococcaceae bacterium]|nr:hypothetical protein [Methylococcaceae bacterium]
MVDKNDYAILSAAVYNNVADDKNKLDVSSRWTQIATSSSDLSGFGAVAEIGVSSNIPTYRPILAAWQDH